MLKVHGKRVTPVNASKLQNDRVVVGGFAQLEVFDTGYAHTAPKIEHKRAQFNIPPGRAVLQCHKAKVRCRNCGIIVVLLLLLWLLVMIVWMMIVLLLRWWYCLFETLLHLSKATQHAIAIFVAVTF